MNKKLEQLYKAILELRPPYNRDMSTEERVGYLCGYEDAI